MCSSGVVGALDGRKRKDVIRAMAWDTQSIGAVPSPEKRLVWPPPPESKVVEQNPLSRSATAPSK